MWWNRAGKQNNGDLGLDLLHFSCKLCTCRSLEHVVCDDGADRKIATAFRASSDVYTTDNVIAFTFKELLSKRKVSWVVLKAKNERSENDLFCGMSSRQAAIRFPKHCPVHPAPIQQSRTLQILQAGSSSLHAQSPYVSWADLPTELSYQLPTNAWIEQRTRVGLRVSLNMVQKTDELHPASSA